jgi:uncharacterized protein YebE (UPF0316 family)
MEEIMNSTLQVWVIIPLLIFFAMILNVTISTIRIIFLAKSMKILAPVLGFFEVVIWLLAISQVMKSLNNPMNYITFALGFSFGNYVGILIENKLAMGMVLVRVITRKDATELVAQLRSNGYTVTNVNAEGNTGLVKIIFTVISRKKIKNVVNTIKQFNPNSFYTVENIGFVSKYHIPLTQKDYHKKLNPPV